MKNNQNEAAGGTARPDAATGRGPSAATAQAATSSPTLLDALSVLPANPAQLLVYLFGQSRRKDIIAESHRDLARRIGTGYDTAARALHVLERAQLIEIVTPGSGRLPTSVRVLIDRAIPDDHDREAQARSRSDDVDDDATDPAEARVMPTWDSPPATVDELCERFITHARYYYRRPDGSLTGTHRNVRLAMKPLRAVAGDRDPNTLSADDVYAAQQWLIDRDRNSRNWVNDAIMRTIAMLKWAARPPRRWISAAVVADAELVERLKPGRSAARESRPVQPVTRKQVDAILPHVAPQVAAMIEVQWCSGCRPGEVCALRPVDIDKSRAVWFWTLTTHKTQHHGKPRVIALDEDAQAALRPFLTKCKLDEYVFKPRDADATMRARRSASRKTPLNQGNRPGTNRRTRPRSRPGERYTRVTYGQAIRRGCDLAFPPPAHLQPRRLPNGRRETAEAFERRITEAERAELKAWREAHRWTPNRLRHAAGTRFREEFGIEAAQVLLGHSKVSTTEIYAKASIEKLLALLGPKRAA